MALTQQVQKQLTLLGFRVDYDLDDSEVWKHSGSHVMMPVTLYTTGTFQLNDSTCYDGRSDFELGKFLSWWIQLTEKAKAAPSKPKARTTAQKIAKPQKGDRVPCRAPHCSVGLRYTGRCWEHVAPADRHIPQPKA